jgi:hypothetical protein
MILAKVDANDQKLQVLEAKWQMLEAKRPNEEDEVQATYNLRGMQNGTFNAPNRVMQNSGIDALNRPENRGAEDVAQEGQMPELDQTPDANGGSVIPNSNLSEGRAQGLPQSHQSHGQEGVYRMESSPSKVELQ